jgi:hypothetical protein
VDSDVVLEEIQGPCSVEREDGRVLGEPDIEGDGLWWRGQRRGSQDEPVSLLTCLF